MPNSLYEEAIAEAKELKSVAEQNAKNAIIEAITPKIRNFIEDQLLSSDNEIIDENQDFLSETVSDLVKTGEESVELDESAMVALIEMLGGTDASDALKNQGTKRELEGAILNTLSEMNDSDRNKLVKIAEDISKNVNNLESMDISIDDSQKVENKIMPDNDDVLYEVDLNDLAEMIDGEIRMKLKHTSSLKMMKILKVMKSLIWKMMKKTSLLMTRWIQMKMKKKWMLISKKCMRLMNLFSVKNWHASEQCLKVMHQKWPVILAEVLQQRTHLL